MNQLTILQHPALGQRAVRSALAILTRLGEHLSEWAARRRAREALLALDDAALKDIGVSRAQALYELDHPRWRQ